MQLRKIFAALVLNAALIGGALSAEDDALFTTKSLTPDTALKAATAALDK